MNQRRKSCPGGNLSKPSSLIIVISFWFSTVALILGFEVLVFNTSATYLARGSEKSPRGIIVKNRGNPTPKAPIPPQARRGNPNQRRPDDFRATAVSRLICSIICD